MILKVSLNTVTINRNKLRWYLYTLTYSDHFLFKCQMMSPLLKFVQFSLLSSVYCCDKYLVSSDSISSLKTPHCSILGFHILEKNVGAEDVNFKKIYILNY